MLPFNIQGPELILILVIALLVLGPGRLPDVGSALGKSIREFRKAATDVKEATSIEPVATSTASAPAAAPPAAAPIAPAQTESTPADQTAVESPSEPGR